MFQKNMQLKTQTQTIHKTKIWIISIAPEDWTQNTYKRHTTAPQCHARTNRYKTDHAHVAHMKMICWQDKLPNWNRKHFIHKWLETPQQTSPKLAWTICVTNKLLMINTAIKNETHPEPSKHQSHLCRIISHIKTPTTKHLQTIQWLCARNHASNAHCTTLATKLMQHTTFHCIKMKRVLAL